MKIFLYLITATLLEAVGDAVLRLSLNNPSLVFRIAFFFVGALLLTAYGTTLNLAPMDFGTVTGLYVAMVFVMFQVTNFVFFHKAPSPATIVGGALIIAGGTIIYAWR